MVPDTLRKRLVAQFCVLGPNITIKIGYFTSLIAARYHTFVEIYHEIISTAILLPSADSRRVVVSYKRKYVYEVLVNHFVKLAQVKMWLSELTILT